MSVAIATLASIGSLYDRTIVETGREAELVFFLAFLVSFGFIRTSAHMIRAQVSWWPGNVEVGGTHIHHLVWGIILLMIAGWIGVTQQPDSPWWSLTAVLFGVGAGLTLDEFALWLTLRDVYWEEEGRKSIDAVIVVTAVAGILLVGFRSWIDVATGVENYVFHLVGWTGLLTLVAVGINLSKEKFGVALVGFVVPLVAVVGALRLGRPSSLWARGYSESKRQRARERFAEHRGLPLPGPLDRLLRRQPDRNEDSGHSGSEGDGPGGDDQEEAGSELPAGPARGGSDPPSAG